MAQGASGETLHSVCFPLFGQEAEKVGTEKRKERRDGRAADTQASPGRGGGPAQAASGVQGGAYLVRNTSRAFLPQPQGRGHVFQHLKHVIVTDAPTGDPAHRTEAEWGPREGPRESPREGPREGPREVYGRRVGEEADKKRAS